DLHPAGVGSRPAGPGSRTAGDLHPAGVGSRPAGPGSRTAGKDTRGAGKESIGIMLLEAPANRMDDPRARIFIVDHVNPGTEFTRRFKVTNSSSRPQHVELYASGASVGKGGFAFAPARTPNELSSWIRLSRSAVDLKAHGSATAKATIDVPAMAVRGERYAVIWAEVSSSAPGPQGNVALVNRVGIRTYLDVGPGGEPPSDFRVGEVLPQRAEDGRPRIVASVFNTGERALDISGQLSLSDGPSSLSAGPFRAARNVTVAPGERGEMAVVLGEGLPDGPWKFHLALQSGRVKHTVTGTLTFPEKAGTWGPPASLDSPLMLTVTLAGLVALAAAVPFLVFGFRRLAARRQRLSASGLRDDPS
ncbi:hypothetical protein, partial [Streptosporangium sp. NPDC003464]